MPGRLACSATPSTFQNAVAPATRRASSALTAPKPIVVSRTRRGSPPAPWATGRRTPAAGVPPRAWDQGGREGGARRQAGHAGAPPLEIPRGADGGLGEHRRERA